MPKYTDDPANLSQLHRDAVKAVQESLASGERVLSIVQGQFNASLIATDRRVFLYKRGFVGGAGFGRRIASWEYRYISGIQIETGPITGRLSVQGPGISDRVRGVNWGDAHVLTIERKDYDRAKWTATLIREQMARNLQPVAAVVPAPAQKADLFEQLRKLGELRDAGIVTPAEFEAKKAELLSRM
jgi:hypothetical protein